MIAIIAAIVVIAVAAAAALVLTSNNGNSSSNGGGNGGDSGDTPWQPKDYGSWEPASKDVGLLTVFGNANGDSVINSDDLALIKRAIPLYSALTAAQSEKSTADKGTDESAKAAAAAKVSSAKAALDSCLPTTMDASWVYKGNATTYYLADANCDGKIDALDSALVEKIIKVREPCTTTTRVTTPRPSPPASSSPSGSRGSTSTSTTSTPSSPPSSTP